MNNVEELVDFLKRCDDAYYNGPEVIVSNDTYDSMVESLKRMDPTNPYLDKVGAVANGSNKVGRIIPMGTLEKYHTDDEVKDWLLKEDPCYVMLAPKYDGFGVELTYVDGKLTMASTRGDGNVGEDVTDAMKSVKCVPLYLPDEFKKLTCVRGEAIIPRANHGEMKKMGYTAMRNAVPGIVRSNNKAALTYVEFVAYEFFDGDTDRALQREKYDSTFNVEDYQVYTSNEFDEILNDRNKYGAIKDSYNYEIDGTVLKTLKILKDDLRHPVHQIAWKFKSNRRETILRSVEFNMGVTGIFSVVGTFDEVEFQGAKLTRASLGSVQRFKSLNPKIGSVIEVSRRGDIIPYIEEIVYTPEDAVNIEELQVCPHCGKPLSTADGSLRCVNRSCPEKLRQQIMYYVGTIGVKGIGPALVRGLVDSGKIKSLSDVYSVKDEDILSLPRQGQSSVDKWNAFISKEIQPIKFLSAMPFDDIGPKVWETLLESYSVDQIISLRASDIAGKEFKGIGEVKMSKILDQLEEFRDDMRSMYEVASIK